jgi:phage tail tape-measure protein
MRLIYRLSAAAMLVLLLAGCGTQEPGRATGSAATGAATGATVGLLGGPVGVVVGALIGGGAGAATGAAVDPKHINLGPPPWGNEPN